MDDLVIFYRPGTCSLASMITAEWSHIPYQLCRLEGAEPQRPEYLKLNPLGEVPTLVHDSQVLTESLAILQYLGRQNLGLHLSFHPSTIEYDKMNQILSYLVSTFHQSFSQQSAIRIRENFEYVEEYLVPKGLIFGHRTIADAYLFATARWGKKFFDIPNEFPRIASFLETLSQDGGVQFGLSVEKNLISQTTGNFRGHVDLKTVSQTLRNEMPGLQIRRDIDGAKYSTVTGTFSRIIP